MLFRSLTTDSHISEVGYAMKIRWAMKVTPVINAYGYFRPKVRCCEIALATTSQKDLIASVNNSI